MLAWKLGRQKSGCEGRSLVSHAVFAMLNENQNQGACCAVKLRICRRGRLGRRVASDALEGKR